MFVSVIELPDPTCALRGSMLTVSSYLIDQDLWYVFSVPVIELAASLR